MASVNSTTFIKKPPSVTAEGETLLYTKELLSGRIFLGCYEERRYVPVLEEYRDVVFISPEENDLHRDLDKVRRKWFGVKEIKWVGITGPDTVGSSKEYCFWVKLSNLPFGHYWFQIKHIKLVNDEVILTLKCIRRSHVPESTAAATAKQTCDKNESCEGETPSDIVINRWDNNFKGTFSSIFESCSCAYDRVKHHITWKNIITVLKVSCALTITLFMGIISSAGQFGEFLLKLIRELTLLVNAVTPILISLLDFLSKIVGGFYILLAGAFIRNRHGGNRNRSNYQVIPYSDLYRSPGQPPIDWRKRNQMLRKELLNNSKKR